MADILVDELFRYIATLRGHVAPVYRLAWSADSRLLVSASKDSTVKVTASNFIQFFSMLTLWHALDMEFEDLQNSY